LRTVPSSKLLATGGTVNFNFSATATKIHI
jgi:hypothetical protein